MNIIAIRGSVVALPSVYRHLKQQHYLSHQTVTHMST